MPRGRGDLYPSDLRRHEGKTLSLQGNFYRFQLFVDWMNFFAHSLFIVLLSLSKNHPHLLKYLIADIKWIFSNFVECDDSRCAM